MANVDIQYPAAAGSATPERGEGARHRYLELSLLRAPELTLCLVGPSLLATLFLLPWFSTTGYASIHGHHGSVTGWQTYSVLRYFLLWCGVGSFILPWMVARHHQVGWRRGEMTAIHGIVGGVLLILNGLGFLPGASTGDVHIQIGYWIALALMAVLFYAGVRSADHHVPISRKPPGI